MSSDTTHFCIDLLLFSPPTIDMLKKESHEVSFVNSLDKNCFFFFFKIYIQLSNLVGHFYINLELKGKVMYTTFERVSF